MGREKHHEHVPQAYHALCLGKGDGPRDALPFVNHIHATTGTLKECLKGPYNKGPRMLVYSVSFRNAPEPYHDVRNVIGGMVQQRRAKYLGAVMSCAVQLERLNI